MLNKKIGCGGFSAGGCYLVARSAKAARHTTKKPANTGAPDRIRTCGLHLRRGLDHKTICMSAQHTALMISFVWRVTRTRLGYGGTESHPPAAEESAGSTGRRTWKFATQKVMEFQFDGRGFDSTPGTREPTGPVNIFFAWSFLVNLRSLTVATSLQPGSEKCPEIRTERTSLCCIGRWERSLRRPVRRKTAPPQRQNHPAPILSNVSSVRSVKKTSKLASVTGWTSKSGSSFRRSLLMPPSRWTP